MSDSKKIIIKLTKSPITSNKHQKAILKALGLRKMQQEIERDDIPSIRGMIAKVDYLVTVSEKN